ncbi:MAG TPA: hypothetical protein VIG24_14390, partial [Acidimicrobiia bacterium]
KERALGDDMGKKLFFSLQGVDFNDDEAIDAFARRVWEQAVVAFGEEPTQGEQSTDNESATPETATGDSDE